MVTIRLCTPKQSTANVNRMGRFSPSQDYLDSILLTFAAVAVVDLIFLVYTAQFRHWFLIPISICGLLIGPDALEWFRGRFDTFDPVGLVGVLGFHFFFVAPLLNVAWGYWIADVAPPPDWRDWLGFMALLNVIGLGLYQTCRRIVFAQKPRPAKIWHLDNQIFNWIAPICIAVSLCAQLWVYRQFGGITGYMQARMDNPRAFEGMGWIFMISESAPILVAFFILVRAGRTGNVSWKKIGLALTGLFVLQMIFGGLRGSRSETVLLLFWVVGCVHFICRPIPRKFIFVGCVFLSMFLYLYGFYKNMGTEASRAFSASSDERDEMEETTGRSWKRLAVDDLGRSDVQAFILFRLKNDPDDFAYAKGRTYLGALSLLVPHWVSSKRFETIEKEGTEIQTGTGGYFHDVSWSSRVYGLAGEGMLNFGLVSVPVVYGLYGLFVGWFRHFLRSLSSSDARLLLIPFGVYMCVSAVSADSDNLTYGLIKNGLLPFLVVFVCSRRNSGSLSVSLSPSPYRVSTPA